MGKMIEALLVLTIPIVAREAYGITTSYDELVDLGFPIVVVERWSDITPKKLKAWWKALSPRLEKSRRTYLTTNWYWHFVISHIHYDNNTPWANHVCLDTHCSVGEPNLVRLHGEKELARISNNQGG